MHGAVFYNKEKSDFLSSAAKVREDNQEEWGNMEKVIVIDFGGQYKQLVATLDRECNDY